MKKYFFLLIIGAGVCYSNPKKEDEKTSRPFKEIKVLKKTVKEYLYDVLKSDQISSYVYENDLVSNIVTKTKEGNIIEDVKINYEDGKIKGMIMNFPPLKDRRESLIKKIFNYKDDLIISINTDDNGRKVFEELTYNDLNQVTKAKIIENKTIGQKKYMYYADGNLSKRIYSSSTSKDVDRYYSYDNKHNSFGLVFSDVFIKINIVSKNNVKTQINDGITVSYEYEYNSDDYPTKIIEIGDKGKKSITTIEYE
ncbi:MAG: hypothetical protein ABI576_10570 [Flavobacterium sp.]